MDIGVMTFGTLLTDPFTGERVTQRERLSEVVEGAVLAEELGFAWYAVGEHHFGDRDLISSPPVVLAAIAARTTSITVGTATTLVSNRDPVLVAEDYATLDLISNGRLQLIAGTSFYEAPYEVFGQELASKPARKRENLELLLRLWAEDRVTWEGQFRPPLRDIHLQPRLVQSEPPVWVSGSLKPDSIHLAVDLGLPMVMGTVARTPEENAPMFALYRELWAQRGRPPQAARTGAASHVFVAETSQQARSQWREYLANYFNDATIPKDATRPAFDFDTLIAGQAICGSPAEVVDKLGRLYELWGHKLHLLTIDLGGIPAATVAKVMELVGSEVIPQVASLGSAAKVAADA